MSWRQLGRFHRLLLIALGIGIVSLIDRSVDLTIFGAAISFCVWLFLAWQLWISRHPDLTDLPYRLAIALMILVLGVMVALSGYSLVSEISAMAG